MVAMGVPMRRARVRRCKPTAARRWALGGVTVTALDLPLFGDPDPVQRPGKTALGYLSWLNDVDVDGWHFWALAG